MTLQRLIDYIEMDRWADPAYRAYDLRKYYGPKGVAKALKYAGYGYTEPQLALWQVWADLTARNVQCSELPQTLYEWYIWQRLSNRELKQWQLRQTTDT